MGIKLASPWIEGAWAGDPEAGANVAFIVRACNSYYEMREALIDLCNSWDCPNTEFYSQIPRIYAAAQAALASADTLPKGRDAKQGSVRSKGSATAKPGRPNTGSHGEQAK